MTDKSRLSGLTPTVVVACLVLLLASTAAVQAKSDEWLDELDRMEREADQARYAFWCGRYEDAERQFASLTGSVHPSVILYLNERAMCSLALGDFPAAEERLRQVDSLLNTYYSAEREKRAMSAFGAEAEKVYRGDPYEQAAAYLLLALILIDRGDYDNALAACKSGIFADSDAAENLFDSDIALLHALEAKCYQLRGQEEQFRSRREAAAKSVRLTSAAVREDFSRRQDLLELLKMSRKERRQVGEERTDDEIRNEIQNLSDKLDRNIAGIDAMTLLGPLYTGEYNVLVLVPGGRCVDKTRTGTDAEMVVLRPHVIPCGEPELYLDMQPLDSAQCLPETVDLEFQALTRGGRRMDAILRGKAASRATTRGVGKAITDVGSNVGGLVGLGVALVGGAIQGAAGSMTAEADTRCWQTLPREFQVYALRLPPGDHEIAGAHYLYFQKRETFKRRFTLTDEHDMATVVVPPPAYKLYFRRDELKLLNRDRTGIGEASTLLIPPPTGLNEIIGVRVAGDNTKPEAIAPDPKRFMRSVRKVLAETRLTCALVSHEEVMASRGELADQHRRALQCHFVEIAREGNKKAGSYRAKLTFSLIDTKTGHVLASRTTEGVTTDVRSGPSTALYSCIESATEAFLRETDVRALSSVPAK